MDIITIKIEWQLEINHGVSSGRINKNIFHTIK